MKRRNGYLESIRIGTEGVGRFRGGVYYGSGDREGDGGSGLCQRR